MADIGIELEVYRHTDPTTLVDVINGRVAPSFMEEIKGPGAGNVNISMYEPKVVADPTLLAYRNILKYRINGKIVGAIVIQKKTTLIIDATPDQEFYQISGENLRTWTNDASTYPDNGLKLTSFDTRAFNFSSPEGDWYDPSQWAEPTRIVNWGDVVGSPWRYAPADWPDVPNAQWVWSSGSTSVPAGDNYFRLKFSVLTAGTYSLFLAADDQYSVYIDGQLNTQSDPTTSAWSEVERIDVTLDVGDHIIGIKVTNVATGPAALIAALFSYTPVIPVVVVGTFTMTIANPAVFTLTAHGLTVGESVFLLSSGNLPTGFSQNVVYYVQSTTTNTFKLTDVPGGAALVATGTQSGTHTLNLPSVPSAAVLVTYTGLDVSYATDLHNKATTKRDADHTIYTALPAGNASGTATQQKQATAKANALAVYNADLLLVIQQQAELDAAGASGLDWKVAGYPDPVPGWSPGEIMLTLLAEAEARGLRFPTWLTPNFTTTEDSYGNTWDRSLDWSFDLGSSLAGIVEQMEELVCDVWVDPDTLELNMVAQRGVDRSIYIYAGDGITPLSTPLVFEKGKNLGISSIDGVSEIMNSLIVKTSDGYVEINDSDTDSTDEYGRLESYLETDASTSVSNVVAEAVFEQKANPEEGASYSILPIEGYVPFVDFGVGDWVLAPNDVGLSVRRRVMSISAEEDNAGNPSYSVEFDTIFQDDDAKINAWLQKLGGGSLGGQFSNSGGGSTSPIGVPTVAPPSTIPIVKIPISPINLAVNSAGLWSVDGVTAYAQVTFSWDAVALNTDGSQTVPAFYEVWGKLADLTDNAYQLIVSSATNAATFHPFQTGSTWDFKVRAADSNSANSYGAFSDVVEIIMSAPNTPMDAPDAPTVTSDKGVLIIAWDGLLLSAAPPPQFRYVYAKIATTSGGTYTRMGATLANNGRTINISGLTVGTTYYIELFGVDGLGLETAASAYGSTTLLGIDLGSLDADVAAAIDAADAAAIAAHGTDNLLIDPSFEANDPTIWSLETSDVTNVTTTPRSGLRSLSVKASSSAYTASRYGHNIPVQDGESYYLSAWVRALGAGSTVESGVALQMEYGVDEAHMTSVDEVSGSPDGLATAYALLAGTWSVPTGTRFIRPIITTLSDTGSTNTYLFDDMTLRTQIPGSLIVDGAITAGKIQAGAVTAEAIAADSIAAESIQADAVTADKIAADTITGELIAAATITGDLIAAGTIEVTNLDPGIGGQLDISANDSVNILVGQLSDLSDDQDDTDSSLQDMQTYYQFGPSGAIVSSPSSPFAIHIASDKIEILQNSVPVSYWNSGQMYVNSFIGTEVVLGNHKLEKYGTGTVVRTV